MFNLNTNEIVKTINGKVKNLKLTKILKINNVVINHNDVKKNDIFVAIKGKNFDGHSFANLAIEKGAIFAIVQQNLVNLPQIVVKNTRNSFLQIAALNRSKFNGNVVAVTGSAGKTTIKDMIALILSSNKNNILKTQQNLNNEIGVAKTLLNLNETHKTAVIELGMSHPGEISILSQAVKPTLAVLSNIGTAHFENFNSIDEILQAKLEILHGMNLISPIVINFDDPKLKNLHLKHKNVITCSMTNSNANFYVSDVCQTANKTCFFINFKQNNKVKIELPMLGLHNVMNALISFAVAFYLKITPQEISKKLANFIPTGMRQKIINNSKFKIIADCYNATPQAMQAALNTLSNLKCNGKKIAVLGDMLELGQIAKTTHEQIGKLINKLNIDRVVCFGNLSKHIINSTNKQAVHFSNRTNLINFLKTTIKPGDVVLFKASHAMNFENIVNEFI